MSEDFCHIRELQLEVYVMQNSVKISENSIKNLEILLNLSSFFRNLEYSCSLMKDEYYKLSPGQRIALKHYHEAQGEGTNENGHNQCKQEEQKKVIQGG